MLLQAERPMIMPGGGVILAEAAPALMALAEYLQIPVTPTYMGKGAIREDHRLYAGIAGIQTSQRYANALFLESDLVLAVGARFADRHTGDLDVYRGDRTFVQVDIEPYQIGRVFPPDLGIVSDAGPALDAMLEVARDMTPPRAENAWTERVTELRSTLLRRMDFDDAPIKPQRVYKEVNEVFDEDTVFLTAIGLYQIFSGQFQKTYQPRHYICCGQAGPLGWEVPACIGAKLGAPDKLIVGIVGDYSFQFLVEELAVGAQYDVPFVLIMLNNEYLGLIRMAEDHGGYDMKYEVDIHYDTSGSDNVKIMEAYGCSGVRVADPSEIRASLEWARKEADRTSRPVLVEIMIEREGNTANGTSIAAMKEFEPLP
jgi:tartronate-semialdehyde synthase